MEEQQWTMDKLIGHLLAQGKEVRDCEDCELEDWCTTIPFYCNPFYGLVDKLVGVKEEPTL